MNMITRSYGIVRAAAFFFVGTIFSMQGEFGQMGEPAYVLKNPDAHLDIEDRADVRNIQAIGSNPEQTYADFSHNQDLETAQALLLDPGLEQPEENEVDIQESSGRQLVGMLGEKAVILVSGRKRKARTSVGCAQPSRVREKKKRERNKRERKEWHSEKCKYCDHKFFQPQDWVNHFVISARCGQYACFTCGRQSKSKTDLTYHLRIHTNEKPFSCRLCPDASFAVSSNLYRHMESAHPGEKNFVCERCDHAFFYVKNFKKHQDDCLAIGGKTRERVIARKAYFLGS